MIAAIIYTSAATVTLLMGLQQIEDLYITRGETNFSWQRLERKRKGFFAITCLMLCALFTTLSVSTIL